MRVGTLIAGSEVMGLVRCRCCAVLGRGRELSGRGGSRAIARDRVEDRGGGAQHALLHRSPDQNLRGWWSHRCFVFFRAKQLSKHLSPVSATE